MHEPPPDLRDLAAQQNGLLTRAQALTVMTEGELRWALRTRWQPVHRGVLSTTTGGLSPGQRLTAAALFAGEEAQLSSLSAARWHGLAALPVDPALRFVVPWNRNSRRTPGVVVRRTSRPDPRPWSRGVLLISSPARAVADAALELRGEPVRALVIEAVQRRLVTVDQLQHQLEDGPVRHSAGLRAAILEAAGGAWSLPESELFDVVRSSRTLPTPWANPVLTTCAGEPLPSPDLWFEDVGLAVQVHSRRHHLLEQDWRWTLRSDTSLGVAGVPVLAFVPTDVRAQRTRVLTSIERAHRQLVRQGSRPDVVARAR